MKRPIYYDLHMFAYHYYRMRKFKHTEFEEEEKQLVIWYLRLSGAQPVIF